MPEMTTTLTVEPTCPEERIRKLAEDKSYLQLVMHMINRVSAASGLEDTVASVMHNILDVVGGTNIVLYYWINNHIIAADVYGRKVKLDAIDDDLVLQVISAGEAREFEHEFSNSQMTTREFGKAYTWVYPLRVRDDLIGVLKMESLNMGMREMSEQLPTFFNYTALVLKNEILGHTQLKQAYDKLSEMNKLLELEIKERELTEEALCQARNELEESQQALLNIVEDLNFKTEEMERANAKLQDLDRLKSLFIASMSHELRTPLNSIIGFSSIIHDEWLGPVNPEQKENLDTIRRSGKHLLSLINDVIDVSKIEAGRIETRVEEFDLYDLLAEAVQYVEKDLTDKGLELHLNIVHHQLGTDRRRLLQSIINLLSNAVKFTEQGAITVSAAFAEIRPDKERESLSGTTATLIDISVGDTGIGISADEIPKLFKPFVRLDSSLKTTVPGTGLGLYLTRKLVVDVLGGDIICESEIGAGSNFIVRIPERIYEKGAGS